MPIYEYRCQNCGYQFALLEPMDSASTGRECPKCGGRDTRRTVSHFSSHNTSPGCKPSGG